MSMVLRFPAALRPGDRIGVTSPSAGVGPNGQARIDFAIDWLRRRGFEVVVGDCMAADRWVSAPKGERAAELTRMLLDPSIRAIVPPWGGAGTALDLVDQLDYAAIAAAEPTWVVGYSDSTAWMVPLTLRAGLATLHGDSLSDTPYRTAASLTHWTDFTAAKAPVLQSDSHMIGQFVSLSESSATQWKHIGQGAWRLHGADRLDVKGTLIGGCTEIMAGIAGTPYGDVPAFAREQGDLIVYLEAADADAFDICRYIHHLRYAGWFDRAVAVLIARTNAPPGIADGQLTQDEAVLDALDGVPCPIVFDLEIGHVPPHLPLLNGARAHVVVANGRHEITQSWP